MATDIPDRAYSDLLEGIYHAALNPDSWPVALSRVAQWLGASRALMFTPARGLSQGGFFYPHGVSSAEMAIWNAGYVGADFWTYRTVERKLDFEGSIVLDGDLSTRAELLASDYYRQHLTRMGIGWLLGGVVLAPTDGGLPMVAASFYRDVDAIEGFGEAARARMALVLPHLSRALGVMFRLHDSRVQVASSIAAMNALNFGVLLLDRHGGVMHANRAAEAIFAQAEGLALQGGRLLVDHRESRGTVDHAIRSSLDLTIDQRVSHFSEAVRVPRKSGTGAYLLQMSHLPEGSQFGTLQEGARAVVFMTDENRLQTPDPGVLERTFGLSRAEAKCAIALGEGTVDQAAARLGVSPHTVRTQLKQVYAKTACSSRTDLTRLLLSLAKG